nr:hypothetical protein [Marinobacter caseinilyticus]
MKTQTLVNTALNGLDRLGFMLDQRGITSRVNRHNLAAFIMVEQKHLEGEWESLQVRFERRKSSAEALVSAVETRAERMLGPIFKRGGSARS